MGLERLANPVEAFFCGVSVGSDSPSVVLGAAARVEGLGSNALTLGVHPEQGTHVALQEPFEHRDRVHWGSIRPRWRVAGRRVGWLRRARRSMDGSGRRRPGPAPTPHVPACSGFGRQRPFSSSTRPVVKTAEQGQTQHPLKMLHEISCECGRGLVADAHTGSTTLLTIHACLPTCRPRANPNCSRSSTVALNRKRPGASRPVVTSEMASTRPPPAWAIWSSAPSSAARATPWPRCFLST